MTDFTLRDRLDVSLQMIGSEKEPLLIIESVMQDPSSLVDYAADQVSFTPAWGPAGGYPGVRAPAPLNYVNNLVRMLDPIIRRAFALDGAKLARAECNFSLVSLRPEELVPLQRIPHADTVDPHQFALLHYLCPSSLGGTAFYRHVATGFETLSEERWSEYERVRAEELAGASETKGYIRGDTQFYKQTAAVEAGFDRVIIYRSRTLHSGQIPEGAALPPDPRTGRLTANIFINYKAS